MSTNTSACPGTTGISILPSQNAVCGIRSLQVNLAACCGDAEIKTSQCSQYCTTSSSIGQWHQCLSDKTNTSYIADAFCQSQLTGNTTETVHTSFAASSPRASFLLIFLALSTLLFAGVDAMTVPSLAGDRLARRQSMGQNGCSVTDISQGYTTVRLNTVALSPQTNCTQEFCEMSADVDTGILNNNRTINAASAAEAKYDAFFDMMHDKTGHWFPALSKSTLHYSYLQPMGNHLLDFTPFAWCYDATATGCGDVLNGNNATTPVTICGPDFVEDPTEATLPSASIQGVFSVVTIN